METLYYSMIDSPVGPLTIVASVAGIMRVEFGGAALPRSAELLESAERTRACADQLREYFAGRRREFTVPLDLRGTDFQKRCWQALLQIPYGETRSYAQIARAIGSPQAFRAVGLANHSNPVAIIVPCHRVLASNGGLCGYGGGVDVKQKLLELEGARTPTM